MFRNKTRGSCTSSAIYLNGCLKALGIPTRTVLCIPIIDASDEREFELIRNLKQPAVRQHLMDSLSGLKNSWASHTFNEVYVGKHWHRLNYKRLGQGIYDGNLFGLITHVATVNDWADAKAHEMIGRRQKTDGPKDIFGFRNPYSTISLRDEIGVHSKVELPKLEPQKIAVENVYWTDDDVLSQGIRDNCKKKEHFGLIAHVTGAKGFQQFLTFVRSADNRVFLNSEKDHPQLRVEFEPGCFWLQSDGTAYI